MLRSLDTLFVLNLLPLDHNRMADGQMRQKVDDVLMVGVSCIRQVILKFGVEEVEVLYLLLLHDS